MTPEEIKKIRIELEFYQRALEEANVYIKALIEEFNKLSVENDRK